GDRLTQGVAAAPPEGIPQPHHRPSTRAADQAIQSCARTWARTLKIRRMKPSCTSALSCRGRSVASMNSPAIFDEMGLPVANSETSHQECGTVLLLPMT